MIKQLFKNKKLLLVFSLIIIAVIFYIVATPIKARIDSNYIESIQGYYSIELPKKGEVRTYNSENGTIEFIEIYMNKRDYDYVVNQLEKMNVEPYSEDLSVYYGIKDTDIEGSFFIEKRTAEGAYHMLRDNIYISSVNNGKFRVIVEMGGMVIE